MINRRILRFALPLAVCTAIILSFFGCEEEPAGLSDLDRYFAANPYVTDPRPPGSNALHITPDDYYLLEARGQKIAFRASGGTAPYRWDTATPGVGSIQASTVNSDTAIYTANTISPNTVIVYDTAGRSAIATIRVIGGNDFVITPETVGLLWPSVGDTVQFRASGGIPPYGPWSTAFPQMGTVDSNGVYTVASSTILGTNTVTVADANGAIAEATVSHSISTGLLRIIPSTLDIPDDGEEVWMQATGGIPPYQWSITFPARGTIVSISPDTSTMVYRRTTSGDQTIILQDSLGGISQQLISQPALSPPVITPGSTTLQTNEFSVLLSVAGGTPLYTWSVVSGTGTINPSVGEQTVYSKNPVDPPSIYIVRVVDSSGQTALTSITQK